MRNKKDAEIFLENKKNLANFAFDFRLREAKILRICPWPVLLRIVLLGKVCRRKDSVLDLLKEAGRPRNSAEFLAVSFINKIFFDEDEKSDREVFLKRTLENISEIGRGKAKALFFAWDYCLEVSSYIHADPERLALLWPEWGPFFEEFDWNFVARVEELQKYFWAGWDRDRLGSPGAPEKSFGRGEDL